MVTRKNFEVAAIVFVLGSGTCVSAQAQFFQPGAAAGTPATQPTSPATDSKADLRVLQAQVSSLQQSLAESNAQNIRLQQENTAFRRRLGMAPAMPPGMVHPAVVPVALPTGEDPSALFIELPAVKWGSDNATDKQELLSHIPGASISLKPFSSALSVKAANPSHLTLLKPSKSLGDATAIEAGNLFVKSGSLYLQWAAGDQSAALDALKYASLEVREQPDAPPKIYSMVHPEEISVTLNQPAPVKLALPTAVAAKGKLALLKPSTDWQSTNATDGSLSLEQNGLKVEIKLGLTGGVTAICDNPDPDHAQRRLDALDAKYEKEKVHLADLQHQAELPPKTKAGYWEGVPSNSVYFPPTVEDRASLNEAIHLGTADLAGMDKARPRIQAELDAVNAKTAAIGRLDGTVVAMTLPNGIQVAQITLKAGK